MSTDRDEYADRVRAWADQLRGGSTRTWPEFLAAGPSAPAGPSDRPLPGAAQLELVRRLAGTDLPDFGRLADLVLTSAGAGRGLVDVPLPWPADAPADRIGSPPTEPAELPADEILRVCATVLGQLLAAEPAAPPRRDHHPWRPWRRSFALLGAPTTVALVRSALRSQGLREGGARTTYFVLGGPLEDLMAQRWSARVRAGAGMRWQRMWRTAETNDRVPPGVALPALAQRLAEQVDPSRVHVVLAADATTALAHVAEVLGVAGHPVAERPDTLATDLLRRVNPVLGLRVGDEERRRVVGRTWRELAGGEGPYPLAAPARRQDWAVRTGERMAEELTAPRYAVHGDPSLVVPARRPGVRRAPDPDDVLRHAVVVIGRAWRRTVDRERPAGEARWHGR